MEKNWLDDVSTVVPQQAADSSWLDDVSTVVPQQAADSSWLDGVSTRVGQQPSSGTTASDLAKSVKVGVQRLPGMVAGLADLPVALATGARPFTAAADALGEATGFQPGKWADETKFSAAHEQSKKAVDAAWQDGSAADIAKAYITNPGYTANQVAESLPSMVAGGLAARALMGVGRVAAPAARAGGMGPGIPGLAERALGKWAAPVAGGVGEGAVTAGQQMAQYQGEDQQQNALASLGAGVGTGLIGIGAGRVANKLGLETAETAIAKVGTGAAKAADEVPLSLKRRVLGGMVSEALLQELPQSAQEQMWQNWADGKPLMEGVARAGTEGAIAGGVMGAGANLRGTRAQQQTDTQTDQQADTQTGQQTQEMPQLGYSPLAGTPTVFPDGSVALGSEAALAHRYAPQPVQRPSEAMGIDPSAGPLSKGAAMSVDSGTYMPPADLMQQAAPEEDPIVLQNRDRNSAASIAQMQEIAANPDYLRVGPSRDMTSGAPIVFGELPPTAVLGRQELVVDGNGQRVGTQYAVVDAGDLIASNHADGSTVAEYATGVRGKLRSVAGNGRTAGLQAAYDRGTAQGYRQELLTDAASIGVDAQALAGMQRPVLVRVMSQGDVTADMGDRTNITGTQKLSPVEQAANDARRFDIANLAFDEGGNPTAKSIAGFVSSMPVSEQGDMMNPDGSPTRQAVDRLMAATFKQAYDSDELVQLYAQAADPDARAVLSAAADASGVIAALSGTEFDVRQAVADAVKMAVNASRQGLKLSDVLQNADFDLNPEAYPVATFLAQNIRSPKAMAEGLRRWGQLALQQARVAEENKYQGNLLGDPTPTLSRQEIFARIGDAYNPTEQAVAGRAQPQEQQAQQEGMAAIPGEPSAPVAQVGAAAQEPRPRNWRTSMLGAVPVAKALGIEHKGKRLAQVVAEIDARDSERNQPLAKAQQAQAATEDVAIRSAKDEIPGESSALAAKQRWEQAKADEVQQAERDKLESDKYNAYVREQEFQAERRRLQGDRIIQQANGKPFKKEASAQAKLDEFDLADTHAIQKVDGGFVLRDRREGRESYTQAQTAVLEEMGIGENADGEIDATDEQFNEIERRVALRLGRNLPANDSKPNQPPARTQQAQAATESVADAQEQGAMFSRAGNPDTEAQRQFKETERAYGGREAYDRAKAAGKTKLTYGQWVQVRTPNFKAWFGDWEIARKAERSASTFAEAREQAKAFQGKDLMNYATGLSGKVSRNSLDKMLSEKAVGKSETPAAHAAATANVDALFQDGILGWSKPDRSNDSNIAAVHRLFSPLMVGGKPMLAKVTVREMADAATANRIYSVESVEFNEKSPAAQWVAASAAADGIDLTSTRSARDVVSLAQRVQDFNPDTVSKVVDPATGEPLVVYHGTNADFSEFKKEHQRPGQYGGQGFFFTANPDAAGLFGDAVMPVFLQAKTGIMEKRRAKLRGEELDVDHIRPKADARDIWVVMEPTQIKSATGNNGNFDPENPDIRYSRMDDNAATEGVSNEQRQTPNGIPAGLPATSDPDSQYLERRINNWLQTSGWRADRLSAVSLPIELRTALDRFTDATGTRVVLFRNLTPEIEDFNGVNFRDGRVFINETSQHPATLTAAHEWVHNFKRTNPKLYQQLEDEVREQGRIPQWHQRNIKEEGMDRGIDHAIEELTAAAVSDAMTDPAFLEQLARRNQGVFRRVAQAFLDFLDTLTAGWRDQGSNAYLRDVQAFRNKLADVLDRLPTIGQDAASFDFEAMRAAVLGSEEGLMSPEQARAILALRRPARATKESVHAALRQLVGGLGLLPNRLGRVVVATAAEIKRDWEPLIGRTGMEASDAGEAQGFYDPKSRTVFLIADHIYAGDELGVVAHELMHKHGQAVLGEEGWNQLHSAIEGWANAPDGSMEQQVYEEALDRVQASRPVGADTAGYSSQELFPYAVQVALEMGVKPNLLAKPGTVERWLGQVRAALRQVWEKITRKPEQFKAQDLVNLAFGIAQRENPAHAGELDGVAGISAKIPARVNKIPNSPAIRHLESSTEISGNLPSLSGVRKVGILLNKSAQADAVGHGRPVEGIPVIHDGEDVKVLVKRDPNDQRMYLHSVATKESLLNRRVSRTDTENGVERSGSNDAGDSSTVATDGNIGKAAPADVADELNRLLTLDAGLANGPMFSRAAPTSKPGAAGWNAPSASQWDDMVYKLQDKHIDTKRALETIRATGKAIADDLDVYLQEELYHGRAAKRTEDFVNNELQPLMAYMSSVGLTMQDVQDYLHARHAKEANAVIAQRNPKLPDGGSGMTNAEADAVLASFNGIRRTQLARAAAQVDAIVAGTRQAFVDYGLESQDTVDGWAKTFAHYVPLMREQDGDGMAGLGTGQGFSIKGREVKGRTGSTRKVVDILANIALQRERAIVRGEKNRVATALVGLAKDNPSTLWQVDVVPTRQTLDKKTGKVTTQHDPLYKQRDNVVVAKIPVLDEKTGKVVVKEHAVVFNESDARAMRMATALKNLDAPQMEGLLGATAQVTRYMAAINTQYNPIFGVTNLARDVQGAALNLASTPLAGKQLQVLGQTLSALAGIYSDERARTKGKRGTASPWAKLWEEFQSVGGQTGYRDQFRTSADRGQALAQALDPGAWTETKWGQFFTVGGRLKVPMEMARKAMAPVFAWLDDYNTAMENGVRLAAYKTALDAGMSKERAASLAKNLTTNFNRKGQSATQVGALYAFFNASVQGTARIGQTLFDMEPGQPKTLRLSSLGKKIVTGGVLLGSLQAVLLAAAGFDDEEPADFVRERNLVIPNPLSEKGYVTIPMSLGFHVLPNLGRIPTEFVLGGFKNPAEHAIRLMGLFADTFNPIGNAGLSMQTLAPTVLDPIAALAENRDFSSRKIAKESFDQVTPGHALARDTATAPAKWLAEAINWLSGGTAHTRGAFSPTPDQIDYLIGQATGGVGRELSKLQQSVVGAAQGDDVPWHKVPLVGRFYGDAGSDSAKQSAYYRHLEAVQRHAAEVKGLRLEKKPGEAQAYLEKHPEARWHLAANAAQRNIRELQKQRRELEQQGAPREQVRVLEQRIVARMERFSALVQG